MFNNTFQGSVGTVNQAQTMTIGAQTVTVDSSLTEFAAALRALGQEVRSSAFMPPAPRDQAASELEGAARELEPREAGQGRGQGAP